jgi:ribosomal protein S18 acetylase RimI-like enzyme
LTDKDEIRHVLETDRFYAAYPLGDLVDDLFVMCEWAAATDNGSTVALAMSFSGFHTPSVFVMGEKDGIEALLWRKVRLPLVNFTLRPEHMAAVSSYYRVSADRRLWRMVVDGATFRRVATTAAVRLSSADLAQINALYAWGGPEYFADYQLERGVYYGLRENGVLVAAAGTHVVAPQYGIAAIGNVYTHPGHRNRGYATTCTGAVAAALLDMGCTCVVLNVRQDNDPALRAYGKLGFRIHCPYIETPGQRRGSVEQIARRAAGWLRK